MLQVTKHADTRVDIILDGPIDRDDMRQGLTQLLDVSEDIQGGRMLYTIRNFELPTLGAIAVEMRLLPQLFKLVRRFERCAVLCETRWIRTVAEVEGALIPGLEIKAFDLADTQAAEAWLRPLSRPA